MARTPKNLTIGQLASTSLTTLYTAPTGINTSISVLSLTNTTDTALLISIYHNDGSTDYLQNTFSLPGGSGRNRLYYGFQRQVINAGDIVKIQADGATAFNYSLSGSEVEVT